MLNLLSPEGEAEMDPAVPSRNQTKKVNNMKHKGKDWKNKVCLRWQGEKQGSVLAKGGREKTFNSWFWTWTAY